MTGWTYIEKQVSPWKIVCAWTRDDKAFRVITATTRVEWHVLCNFSADLDNPVFKHHPACNSVFEDAEDAMREIDCAFPAWEKSRLH